MRILWAAIFFITVASVAFGGNAASLLAHRQPRATRSLMLSSHPANQPKYSVIYNFPGYTLGQYPFGGEDPVGGLLNVSGTLYGMTSGGGNLQGGTIYEATTTGEETVLSYVPYPQFPDTSLIDVAGTLYGTTPCGCAAGTVFSLTPMPNMIPTPTVLYNFGTTTNDGLAPQAPLIDVNGTFYGTTEWGGRGGPNCGTGVHGCGIVFSVSPSSGYRVLHNFRGAPHDGSEPIGGLLDIGGTLYGTTSSGGRGCPPSGCGTVYAITRSGSERVLYNFQVSPTVTLRKRR